MEKSAAIIDNTLAIKMNNFDYKFVKEQSYVLKLQVKDCPELAILFKEDSIIQTQFILISNSQDRSKTPLLFKIDSLTDEQVILEPIKRN